MALEPFLTPFLDFEFFLTFLPENLFSVEKNQNFSQKKPLAIVNLTKKVKDKKTAISLQ